MNLILENSKNTEYYTYLDQVFGSVPGFRSLHWLISDLEINYCSDSRLHHDPVIISGEELEQIVKKEKIQFIWAVLSGFEKEIDKFPENLPYADGNPYFWKGSPKPQALDAEVEIVCWDSTCTLFINVNKDMASNLRELYPDIKDLDKENEARG